MNKTASTVCISAAALMLALCPCAVASTVGYSTTDLGGGTFQYNFTINNTGGTVPLAGLLVENGNTLFGLDVGSAIGAPAGWDFLSPLPPFDDLLSYFSLTPATDVPIGGSLGGFTFDSTADPGSLPSFTVVLVGDNSAQFPITIQEPLTIVLMLPAALLIPPQLLFLRRRRT